MRTSLISFLFAALFVGFAAPAAVFAQTVPQPNGSLCANGSECVSGYCNLSSPIGGGVCATNTGGSGSGSSGSGTVVGGGGSGSSGTVTGGVTLINPLKSGTSLSSFLDAILSFVINIGSIIVILMLVFVGFKFVVAQGNDSKISEARTMLLWTIVGALILLGAKAISSGILATVNSLGG